MIRDQDFSVFLKYILYIKCGYEFHFNTECLRIRINLTGDFTKNDMVIFPQFFSFNPQFFASKIFFSAPLWLL